MYYLEAMAYMKQRPDFDEEALKTLEILSETHRRKAKLLGMRQTSGIGQIKDKLSEQIKQK